MDKAWKRHERAVAKIMGTTRLPSNGHAECDMVVDLVDGIVLAVEHKSRGVNPGWFLDAIDQSVTNARGRMPVVVHTFYGDRANRQIVSMRLEDFSVLMERLRE